MEIKYYNSPTQSTVAIYTENTYTYATLSRPVQNLKTEDYLAIKTDSIAKSLIQTILNKQIIFQRYPNQLFTLEIHDEDTAHAITAASLVFVAMGIFMNFVSYGVQEETEIVAYKLQKQQIEWVNGEENVKVLEEGCAIGKLWASGQSGNQNCKYVKDEVQKFIVQSFCE